MKELISMPWNILVVIVLLSCFCSFNNYEFGDNNNSFISSCTKEKKSITSWLNTGFLLPAYSKSKLSKTSGWFLRQNHVLYGKDIHISISPKGFKWHSKDSDITITMKAPKWDVTTYSTRTKKMHICSPKDFRSPATKVDIIFGGVNWSILDMRKVKRSNMNGITIDYYRMAESPNENVYKTDYWVCPDIIVPKPVNAIMTRLYNAPDLKGFPTKQKYQRNKGGAPKVGFYTYSINRKQILNSTFDAPKNFKKVSSMNNLYRNETHEQGLDLLMRN